MNLTVTLRPQLIPRHPEPTSTMMMSRLLMTDFALPDDSG